MKTCSPCHFEILFTSNFFLIFWVFDWPAVTTQCSTKERERDRVRDRARENQLAHTGARDLPPSQSNLRHREREATSPPPKREAKALPLAHRRGHRHGTWGRSGSGGQPGPALQRQEDRDGQGPAEDRHAAAAAAVETRLGTIEGGFTWGDLREVGVGARQPLD